MASTAFGGQISKCGFIQGFLTASEEFIQKY